MKIKFPKLNRTPLDYSTINVVPYRYREYLIDMNNIYSNVDSSVLLGRDKEINRINNCFFKTKNANAILLGDHGVGKTALVQKLVTNVIKKECPPTMYNWHFLYLDVEHILAMLPSKAMEKKLERIIDFIVSYNNLVIIIDNVHLMQADSLLSYYFSKLVKQPHVKILGISTFEEFYLYFELDKKTRARLEVIPILEPKSDEIYPMIRKLVHRLGQTHTVTISKKLIRYIISVSAAFYTELCNPALTVEIIEKSMIVAKRKHKKAVTKKEINYNFNFKYDMYRKMSLEDKEITAYHEAGHFIVGKLSKNIRNYKTTAITIVPSEDFLGVTMFEFEPEKQTSLDINYYIDQIAIDLAGRIAEIIYFNSEDRTSSGASSDLENATETARQIVTRFGMYSGCGKNMAYFGNTDDITSLFLLSEDIKNNIDKATNELIQKAKKRAEDILTQNITLLHRLAKELITNEVLDESDLNRICKEVERKNN